MNELPPSERQPVPVQSALFEKLSKKEKETVLLAHALDELVSSQGAGDSGSIHGMIVDYMREHRTSIPAELQSLLDEVANKAVSIKRGTGEILKNHLRMSEHHWAIATQKHYIGPGRLGWGE